MISAPACAKPMAIPFPIPRVAPVRMAVFPSSENSDEDILGIVRSLIRTTLGRNRFGVAFCEKLIYVFMYLTDQIELHYGILAIAFAFAVTSLGLLIFIQWQLLFASDFVRCNFPARKSSSAKAGNADMPSVMTPHFG